MKGASLTGKVSIKIKSTIVLMTLGDSRVHQQHTTRNYDVEVPNSIPFILVVDNIPHHVCCEQCSWKKKLDIDGKIDTRQCCQ